MQDVAMDCLSNSFAQQNYFYGAQLQHQQQLQDANGTERRNPPVIFGRPSGHQHDSSYNRNSPSGSLLSPPLLVNHHLHEEAPRPSGSNRTVHSQSDWVIGDRAYPATSNVGSSLGQRENILGNANEKEKEKEVNEGMSL